jgi:hypothetical protein
VAILNDVTRSFSIPVIATTDIEIGKALAAAGAKLKA